MHVQKEAQPLRTSTLMLSVLLTKLDVLRVKPCSLVYRYSCTKEFCLYRCLCMCLCMCMGSVAHGLHLKRVRMCACVRVSRICWHYSNGKDNTTRINLIIRQASSTASTACLLLIRARFPTCPRCCLLTWPALAATLLSCPFASSVAFALISATHDLDTSLKSVYFVSRRLAAHVLSLRMCKASSWAIGCVSLHFTAQHCPLLLLVSLPSNPKPCTHPILPPSSPPHVSFVAC